MVLHLKKLDYLEMMKYLDDNMIKKVDSSEFDKSVKKDSFISIL